MSNKSSIWFSGLFTILIPVSIILSNNGCIAKDAVKAEAKIASVENNLNRLEKLIEQKADMRVVAENIDSFKQEVNNSLLENRGTIKFGGAGWVVLGMGGITLLFMVVLAGLVKYYIKSRDRTNLLTLVTTAIKNSDPNTQRSIKDLIEYETNNGGPFTAKHKNLLSDFVRKFGLFADKK